MTLLRFDTEDQLKKFLGRGVLAQKEVNNILADRRKDPTAKMNKTELRYLQTRIEPLIFKKDIVMWRFEAITFKLADDLRYTPDFLVIGAPGYATIQFHEIKGGYIREDAIVKFKVARNLYPWFSWRMMQYKKGEWNEVLI